MNMKDETPTPKRRPGRPRRTTESLVDLFVTITVQQREWLDARSSLLDCSLSETVRRLFDEARKKEKPDR
jgi:hypothetical protein